MIKKQSQRFEKYVSWHCIYGPIQTFMAGRPRGRVSVPGTPPLLPPHNWTCSRASLHRIGEGEKSFFLHQLVPINETYKWQICKRKSNSLWIYVPWVVAGALGDEWLTGLLRTSSYIAFSKSSSAGIKTPPFPCTGHGFHPWSGN